MIYNSNNDVYKIYKIYVKEETILDGERSRI